MQTLAQQWLRPKRPRDSFPPYELADSDFVAKAERDTRKLARIYHMATKQAWDGRAVLDELIEKHGGIHFPEDKKEAMGRLSAILLWGELAAWSISADLALKLEDPDAKMAASSQVFDEARHFTVLREYLWRAGITVPRLGGYSRTLLVSLLETDRLLYKLVGMQLMVENIALCMFKSLADAKLEPVLTDLLYYFERDEARHVGLGALALPRVLAELSSFEASRLWFYQFRIQMLMVASGLTLRDTFEDLGIDQAAMQMYGFRLQADVYKRMRTESVSKGLATKGLFKVSGKGQQRVNDLLFPKQNNQSPKHRRALETLIRLAKRGDQLLAKRA